MKKVWNSIENEHLLNYMKAQKSFISNAARIGDLDSLRYLHEEIECKWNTRQASIVPLNEGNIHILCHNVKYYLIRQSITSNLQYHFFFFSLRQVLHLPSFIFHSLFISKKEKK